MNDVFTTLQEECKILALHFDAFDVTWEVTPDGNKFFIQFLYDGDAIDAKEQLDRCNQKTAFIEHEGFPTVILYK